MKVCLGRRACSVALVTFVVGGLVGPAMASAAFAASSVTPGFQVRYGPDGETDVNVCSDAVPVGEARCLALERTDARALDATPARTLPGDVTAHATQSAVLGNNGAYDPLYLESAYNAPSATAGAGQTVAIVDAFDDPNAEADLAYYRSYFGLPACTTANGCFRKYDQDGEGTFSSPNVSWSVEISLDLDMVSAMCPRCSIMLIEAKDNLPTNLETAVNRAVTFGANVVSNSYGASESSDDLRNGANFYNYPGVAIVASSGDSGYGVSFPAAYSGVVAVGGTSLHQYTNSGTRNATETAWSGGGSGCSSYQAKPSWQHDTGCTTRTIADVSAVADPNTGVWIYDTYGEPGFRMEGGTSAAAPIVGAMYALAANPASSDTLSSYPYNRPGALNDVTSGANGFCTPTYLCTAGLGYDGPTGLGTPNGTAAFTRGLGSQIVSFLSAPPSTAVIGGASYAMSATASSGLLVTYSIDASSTSGCSVAGTTVSFSAPVGTCVIDANQAGNSTFSAAQQVQQSFAVGAAAQTISFLSSPPANAAPGSAPYVVSASASSGLPVTFSIDASSTSGCSVVGTTVSFAAPFGTCVLDANQAGNSTFSAAPQVQQRMAVGTPPSTPGAPLVTLDATTATLNWTPPTTDGGSAVTTYTITPYRAGLPQPTITVNAALTSATVGSLTPGQTYSFTVTAQNAIGSSGSSTPSAPITVATAPGRVGIASAVAGKGMVTLRWVPPANNGGLPITSYKITPFEKAVGPRPPLFFGPGVATTTLRGLTNGYSYTFTVAAQNAIGIGVPSAATPPLTIGAPSAPTAVSASWRRHKMIVHWVPSRTGNGAAVSGYVVIPFLGSVAQPERIAQKNADALAITGLAPDKAYTFRIAAINGRGMSPESTASNPVQIPGGLFIIAVRF